MKRHNGKPSLFDLITHEELKAEDLVLMPHSLLRPGQMEELIAWLRKSSDNAGLEADALDADTAMRFGPRATTP